MTKLKKALSIANEVERTRAGFFTRNSDNSMTIWIRGAHGNDPNQWINARKVQDALGTLAGEIVPDPQSSHLRIVITDIYGKRGAS